MILGAQVQTSGGRHVLNLALVDGGKLVWSTSYPAPKGASEADQLQQLRVRVDEALDLHNVERIELLQVELPPGGRSKIDPLRHGMRAEGVLLASAGARDIAVNYVSGRGLAAAAGKSKKAEAVDVLCARLDDVPETVRQAAAVAVAGE